MRYATSLVRAANQSRLPKANLHFVGLLSAIAGDALFARVVDGKATGEDDILQCMFVDEYVALCHNIAILTSYTDSCFAPSNKATTKSTTSIQPANLRWAIQMTVVVRLPFGIVRPDSTRVGLRSNGLGVRILCSRDCEPLVWPHRSNSRRNSLHQRSGTRLLLRLSRAPVLTCVHS